MTDENSSVLFSRLRWARKGAEDAYEAALEWAGNFKNRFALATSVLSKLPPWVKPNHLTTAGFLSWLPLVWLLAGHAPLPQLAVGLIAFAFVLFSVAGIFDFLDGKRAKDSGMKSVFGAFYDQLADKVRDDGTLVLLWPHMEAYGLAFKALAACCCLLDASSLGLRLWAMRKEWRAIGNVTFASVESTNEGKLKTILKIAGILLMLLGAGFRANAVVWLGHALLAFTVFVSVRSLIARRKNIEALRPLSS